MLKEAIERYIAIRRSAGHEFKTGARQLRLYAQVAEARGDTHVHTETVLAWAAAASSPLARHVRMRHVVQFARFQHAEDERHEVPPRDAFVASFTGANLLRCATLCLQITHRFQKCATLLLHYSPGGST